ncbi:hypothetical protein, partial [Anaerostipes sp.]|uniref:hypothetical protein n=1 Tax=Anaerostipes sp. TaxID=1872530 RepID=UPI003966CE1B
SFSFINFFLLSFVKIKMGIKRSRYKISAKLYAQMIGYEISIDFLSLKKFRVFLLKLQSLIKNTLVLYHIPKKL